MESNRIVRKLNLVYASADYMLSFAVTIISLLSYYGFNDFAVNWVSNLIYSSAVALATVLVFLLFKIYRIITTNFGMLEAIRVMIAVFAIQVTALIVCAFVPTLPAFRLYVFTWLLSTATLVLIHPLIRVLVRLFNLAFNTTKKINKVRTIVIGAGSMGKLVIDEARNNKNNHNQIVAFVDDDPVKIGGLFANIPVLGPISEIAKIIDFHRAEEVIIAMSKISSDRLHEILSLLDACSVRVRRMPLIAEMEGPSDRRIMDVDLNDLLSRDPIKLDNSQVYDMLHGQMVMVTGAGGSIGSELVRQIFKTHPRTLVLFDIYENSTYDIQMELIKKMRDENIKDIELVTLIGSTYNEVRVEQIIKKYKPDYIYHAAAYKHVPLMEDSPMEAIRTNVIGTYNVARLADQYGVKKMVLVSTDKAVRPTNVMGATKRCAEMIIQHFATTSKNTRYAAVRFGNVLGSNGSVVPLFKKQIEAGGPITITDKEIIRYFMTIPEAVSLILQCGLFAEGGEIFILDMGKPVKILSLAERLIRQAGLVPYVDIDIIETGLRPGEKLYEELLLDTEHQKKTANSRIYVEEREQTGFDLKRDLATLEQAFGVISNGEIKVLLQNVVSTYQIDPNHN